MVTLTNTEFKNIVKLVEKHNPKEISFSAPLKGLIVTLICGGKDVLVYRKQGGNKVTYVTETIQREIAEISLTEDEA